MTAGIRSDQFGWRTLRNDGSVVDNGNAGAKIFRLIHMVRCINDGGARSIHLFQMFYDHIAAVNVHAYGGFIQKQYFGFVQYACDQVHPSFHTTGEFRYQAVGGIREPEFFEPGIDPCFQVSSLQSVHMPVKIEVLPGGEGGIKGNVLRYYANDGPYPGQFAVQVVAIDQHFATRCREKPAEDGYGGRFPRAIGSQQAEYFVAVNGKRDAPHRRFHCLPEGFGQVLNFYDRVLFHIQ